MEGVGMDIKTLCDFVRQTAYEIHKFHGNGYLEKPCENALVHRLRKAGIRVEQQYPIAIYDEDGTLIGDYIADLLVEDVLIVELKTAKALSSEHIAQLMGYLKSARKNHGMLINFGSYKFEIRKFVWGLDHGNQGVNSGLLSSFLLMLAPLQAFLFR
jgi:GxxExxY protein